MSEKQRTLDKEAFGNLEDFMEETKSNEQSYPYLAHLKKAYELLNNNGGESSEIVIKNHGKDNGYNISIYDTSFYEQYKSLANKIILEELESHFKHFRNQFSSRLLKLLNVQSLTKID